MSTLPSDYKKGVERVSNVVSFAFPFKGTDGEMRYKRWLADNNISEVSYMKAAQDMGTNIHNALESYILGESVLASPLSIYVAREIEQGVKFLNTLDNKTIVTEKYCLDKLNRYQGTCDLLYETKEGEWVLSDWKTYGICKKMFKQLPVPKLQSDGMPAIDKGKKDKVRLQMSLYAKAIRETEGIEISKLSLLFIHENGVREVELKPIPDEEIEALLEAYNITKLAKKILPKETIMSFKAPLKITIQTAPVAYSIAKVEVNLKDLDSGQTPEEALNEACLVHKKIHDNLKLSFG